MARTIGKLTDLKVRKAKQPGVYGDGGGLYLRVTPDGAKSWIFRFMLNGRARWMGMGPTHTVSLAEARKRAGEHRLSRLDGIDPIDARRAKQLQVQLDAAKAITFQECADNYIAAHRAGWRNAKHAAQWETTLKEYAAPVIGALPVQAIDTALVLKVLEPIWTEIPETASRLRGRIEAILDWAKVRGYRTGENPARWKGHLDHLLPARGKVRKVEHHAAMPWNELPGFLESLREQGGIAALALEFNVLTAARSGETVLARWSDLNFLDKTWTVPAARMKAGKEHRVPLSARALAILQEMQRHQQTRESFVFPRDGGGKPLSNTAFLLLLRSMGRGGVTAHGFRATFKTWASERTGVANEIVEVALAHAVGSKVEQAYQRGDLFEKRRRLMESWGAFCTAAPAQEDNVTPIGAAQR